MCTNRCSGETVSEEMHEFETEGALPESECIDQVGQVAAVQE